jgi:hypothetical protein
VVGRVSDPTSILEFGCVSAKPQHIIKIIAAAGARFSNLDCAGASPAENSLRRVASLINLATALDEFTRLFFESFAEGFISRQPGLRCVLAHLFGDLHRTEVRSAH